MEGFAGLLHWFAYFLAAGILLNTDKLWRDFFRVFIGVGLFTGLFALLQTFGEFSISQGGLRVDSVFGNAIYFTSYLLVLFFMILFAWFHRS